MKFKPLLIVLGEPYSIFSEILFKFYKKESKKIKFPIIVIGSKEILQKQMIKLKYSLPLNEIDENNINLRNLNNNKINIINVNFKFEKVFDKITSKSSSYIYKSFEIAINILKKKRAIGLINGPISKFHLFKKKFPGVTEYLAKKNNVKNNVTMLIYNKNFSVSPITTHIPLKNVSKLITKKKIIANVNRINHFYISKLKKKPVIAILGLNPHCETTSIYSEEKKIIEPSIKYLKKNKVNISGPFSADTFFFRKNIIKFDVAIGMYHDQVLTPIKTLYNFDAINITIGLSYIRISPDHGTNNKMIGKNKSNANSLIHSVNFFKKLYENKT